MSKDYYLNHNLTVGNKVDISIVVGRRLMWIEGIVIVNENKFLFIYKDVNLTEPHSLRR